MPASCDVLIVGCGDLGMRVATRHRRRGDDPVGVVRSEATAAMLRARGIHPVISDLDRDTFPCQLVAGKRVYYFAPPPSHGQRDPRVRRWLAALERDVTPPLKVIYISTSGVYGDCRGQWVDEARPPHPETDRAKRRLDAERALDTWSRRTGTELVILRVGGIYGPGRLPIERIRSRRPILREEDCPFSNRIHADDLARVAIAAGDRGPPGAVYNVSDGRPGTMTEYFHAVADRLGLPRLPTVPWAQAERHLTPEMLSFLRESRRLDNRKMLTELSIELQYPNLGSGLSGCDPQQRENG